MPPPPRKTAAPPPLPRFPFFCPDSCRECCRFDHLAMVTERDYPPREILAAVNLTPVLLPVMFRRTPDGRYHVGRVCRHYREETGLCRIYAAAPWACRLYPLIVVARPGRFVIAVETGCPAGAAFHARFARGGAEEHRYVGRLRDLLARGGMPPDTFVSNGSRRSRALAKGRLEPAGP
ncbi:YkgJ family cysteine cluster protein [Dissulfurirhabdus thermomarina]|uniref:YkgJ family cysteine cluster protein n=1 Tax=Dissulfurirhabdus thermomarina TaxID=1765737 RepID=UPI0014702EDB|nr:YkgJ family cysteine cluster protein [Dissulfurirhabdus thermomarina]NMX23717.1 YkgJ family cysteine cluster protein [Dissulfurirhabdus thermomarina]